MIFKTIRALSIVTLDGHYSHFPISFDLISTVLSVDSFENIYQEKFIFESIKPIFSHLYENIFLDKHILANQRNYEINSLKYLDSIPKKPNSYENIITKAINEGILDNYENKLLPFTRFHISKEIQPDTDFYTEFRNIQTVKRYCKGVEASLDYNPITNMRYVDFFINKDIFTVNILPQFLYNISSLMLAQLKYILEKSEASFKKIINEIKDNLINAGYNLQNIEKILEKSNSTVVEQTFNSYRKEILPAFKNLFWNVLSFFIKDNFYIDIDFPDKKYEIFSLKFPGLNSVIMKRNIIKAIEYENSDKDRVHELSHLLHSLKRTFNGYIFICLVRIRIYDLSKSPEERLVTDIDSSILKVNNKRLIIELNESKNQKKGRENKAAKDIRKKIVPVLNSNSKGYRVKKVKGYGAKLVISINT